jgi:hypothetical protein
MLVVLICNSHRTDIEINSSHAAQLFFVTWYIATWSSPRSLLGPFLFIIYIHDFSRELIMFQDIYYLLMTLVA